MIVTRLQIGATLNEQRLLLCQLVALDSHVVQLFLQLPLGLFSTEGACFKGIFFLR